MLVQIKEAKSRFSDCWVGDVTNGYGFLLHEILKSTVS